MSDILGNLLLSLGFGNDAEKINEINKTVNVSFSVLKKDIQFDNIDDLIKAFPSRDLLKIEIRDEIDNVICLDNKERNSVQQWKEQWDDFDSDDKLNVQVLIEKTIIDNKLSVYKLEAFNKHFLGLDIINMIKFIEDDINNGNQLVFELYDSDMLLATKTLAFKPVSNTSEFQKIDRKEKIKEVQKNSFAFWKGEYLPLPDDFHFIIDNQNNPYKEKFGIIETLLAIVCIADNVHFFDDKITCQIYGKRMSVIDVRFSELKYNETLFDIYTWIFTEGNIVDKISLARNLLSLHCRLILLQNIDEQTFLSIKANFAIYQKENVDKYIEIKNKLTEFLAKLVDDSKEVILGIVSDIGKNMVAFFSFVLTVFVTSIMSEKGLENIFTKEVTAFSDFFIVCSFVYIGVTWWITNFKIQKLRDSYETMKENNSFFKGTKEFDEIFDDSKVDNTILEIRRYRRVLFLIWFLVVISVLVIVEILSEYGVCKFIGSSIIELIRTILSIIGKINICK
ncbi:hypothetical protein SAMN05216249_10937 [Acetitomaculum ruminis DSM 5522]|uniref:Uncharacterized protein n=1 Tax=Acetitomaculum ruminis DSM 5522 TaxID=1120918 RepID=A0A1I0Y8U9_9FIRM|nr:hypothetical protein [Acetitomaculum ruminis]SFB09779.1 hypothetical protein SAMN05216249_10937 [Acetitomaculum ruminis DSM 5522]